MSSGLLIGFSKSVAVMIARKLHVYDKHKVRLMIIHKEVNNLPVDQEANHRIGSGSNMAEKVKITKSVLWLRYPILLLFTFSYVEYAMRNMSENRLRNTKTALQVYA